MTVGGMMRRMIFLWVCFVTAGVQALPFNLSVEHILRPGGVYYDLASDGVYLYMACKRGVEIYTLSDPAEPELLHTILTPGIANGVSVNGSFLYVGDVYGFNIWNVADPLHPLRMGGFVRYQGEGYQERLTYRDGYIFAAAYNAGLQVIDVSDPFHPVIVAEEDTPGYAWDLALCDDAVFVMDFFSTGIIDISRPEIPVTASELDTMFASGMAVRDHIGFLGYIEGLMVLDLNDPFSPEVLSDIGPTGGGTGESVTLVGDYVVVAHGSYVEIYDVSIPSEPLQVSYFYPPGHPRKVLAVGDYLYTVLDENGFLVTDISDPRFPVTGAHINPGYRGSRQDVVLDGTCLYVCDWDRGLVIYDVSDPDDIREIGSYGTPGMLNDMVVRDQRAYLCCYSELQIVDVSDPAHPSFLGRYATTGHPWSVFLKDNLAFLCDLYSLTVLDISNPAAPERIGVVYLGKDGVPYRCWVKGGIAYLADGWGGLKIISVTDPTHPRVLKTWPGDTSRSYSTIRIEGDNLYVLDPQRGVELLDISRPLQPESVEVYRVDDVTVADFVLKDNRLYLAGGRSGVFVLDISDPTNVYLSAAADTPGNAVGIDAGSGRIYVADDYDLAIYRVSGAIPDTVPPDVWIDLPDENVETDGKVVVIRGGASDGGSGVRYVQVSVDGGETWQDGRGQTSWSFLFSGFDAGWREIRVRAVDWAGNISPGFVRRMFYNKPDAPLILMAGFGHSDPGSGEITIEALVFDPFSPRYIAGVDVYLEGSPTGESMELQWESEGILYFTRVISLEDTAPGRRHFSLVARDHFGNPSVMWPALRSTL